MRLRLKKLSSQRKSENPLLDIKMKIIEVPINLPLLYIAYHLYKSVGTSENRLSDDDLKEKLLTLQSSLDSLKEEGEERFQIIKYSSSQDQVNNSNHILNVVEDMQNVVRAYLGSEEFTNTEVGQEVTKIMNQDPSISINNAMSKALAEIISYQFEKTKLDADLDTNFEFQLLLQKSEKQDFTSEYCELEDIISKIEGFIGRPDVHKHQSLKSVLANIMDKLPRHDPKILDKCKTLSLMVKKELVEIIKSFTGKYRSVDK